MRGIAVLGLIVMSGCGMLSVGTFSRVPVPTELQPEANQKLDMIVAASGVQIYRCDPKKDQPGQYEWVFQAPEAMLRDAGGRYLGKHYAGPTWEATDGSKIVGTVQARRDAPERQSIPWLRLGTRSTGAAGLFSKTTTVLRVATSGGSAPPSGCNDVEQGKIVRVPYKADYNFYVAK
jgi:uncharacterized protein DUF3455